MDRASATHFFIAEEDTAAVGAGLEGVPFNDILFACLAVGDIEVAGDAVDVSSVEEQRCPFQAIAAVARTKIAIYSIAREDVRCGAGHCVLWGMEMLSALASGNQPSPCHCMHYLALLKLTRKVCDVDCTRGHAECGLYCLPGIFHVMESRLDVDVVGHYMRPDAF